MHLKLQFSNTNLDQETRETCVNVAFASLQRKFGEVHQIKELSDDNTLTLHLPGDPNTSEQDWDGEIKISDIEAAIRPLFEIELDPERKDYYDYPKNRIKRSIDTDYNDSMQHVVTANLNI